MNGKYILWKGRFHINNGRITLGHANERVLYLVSLPEVFVESISTDMA